MDAPRRDPYSPAAMTTPTPMPRPAATPALPRLPASLAWRPGPTLLFVGMLLTLLAIGLVVRSTVPPRPAGLPDDPAVADARSMLAAGLPIPTDGYFLVSALAGESPPVAPEAIPLERLAAARGRLREAQSRHPADPRLVVAVAHVDLAAGRFEVAARAYRAALRSAAGYDEARLGLAVTLALQAEQEAEPIRARAKRLAALGQLANIARTAEPSDDAVFGAALVNRLRLLRAVGRHDEAARTAARALAAGLPEPWADRVRAFVRAAEPVRPA